MANRTGTYVAFDGLGQTDPTKSDFRYYGMIQAWDKNKVFGFRYVDSHDKTCAVRDTSKRATLEARIQERLAASKNMLVILSSATRKSGSMLSFELEQAIDNYKIPLIIAYVDYQVILHPNLLSNYWPNALSERIGNGLGSMIHVPYAQSPIMNALPRFTVNGETPSGGNQGFYDADTQRSWGLLLPNSAEQNYLKS